MASKKGKARSRTTSDRRRAAVKGATARTRPEPGLAPLLMLGTTGTVAQLARAMDGLQGIRGEGLVVVGLDYLVQHPNDVAAVVAEAEVRRGEARIRVAEKEKAAKAKALVG